MTGEKLYRKPSKLLHYYALTNKQQIWLCYLIPNVTTFLVYMFHFAGDIVLAYQHLRAGDPIFASITLGLMYLPAIASFMFTVSDVQLWPNPYVCTRDDVKWVIVKILQHLSFPVWAMHRFAEQIFWSIEALRSDNDEQEECIRNADRNSTFELYSFLQAYLQAAPQLLFQIHVIIRHPSDFNKQTVDMQVMCIIMSAVKMSMTTSEYQRFRTQKIAGRSYPWSKRETPKTPTYNKRSSLAEADQMHPLKSNIDTTPEANRRNSTSSTSSAEIQSVKLRLPIALKTTIIEGLVEDDIVAKVISFFWWLTFITARMLCLCLFFYFYPSEAMWVYSFHYFFTLAFLLYDAHISNIPYFRAVFVLFLGFVFMFCLVEFKIKFKKVKFIYFGYFILVYTENIAMTCVWYLNFEGEQDWWYNYVMRVIFVCLAFSLVSMLLYIRKLRAKKVVVHKSVVRIPSSI